MDLQMLIPFWAAYSSGNKPVIPWNNHGIYDLSIANENLAIFLSDSGFLSF
jgi:hypothetical protein